MLVSQIPTIELTAEEVRKLEQRWEANTVYSYAEMARLNRDFIDLALRTGYLAAKSGPPRTSDPAEDRRLKEEHEFYLSKFTKEVRGSDGWEDFPALWLQ